MKIVLDVFRKLVLKISFSRLYYLFQVAILATLIRIIAPNNVWSTATASIVAVPFATDVVELRSAITADFLLARKTSGGGVRGSTSCDHNHQSFRPDADIQDSGTNSLLQPSL